MIRWFQWPVGLVLSALLLLSSTSCRDASRPTVSATEQDIIEAVITGNENRRPSAKRGLFQESSVRLAFVGDMTFSTFVTVLRKDAEYRDPAFHEALEDFIRANSAGETKLVFPTELPENIVLVPVAEIQKIREKTRTLGEAELAIQARFGDIDGIYQISRAGIDSGRRVALICLSFSSRPGTVTGRFYILRFDGSKWIVQKDDYFGTSWMS
jgi:hypothetical protein